MTVSLFVFCFAVDTFLLFLEDHSIFLIPVAPLPLIVYSPHPPLPLTDNEQFTLISTHVADTGGN